MFLLAAHPEGMTGAQLAAALYDDFANQTTLRVEMTRLRRIVGDLLRSRPYRLTSLVTADYLDVSAALRRGDVTAAVGAYAGPLLPSSEAPGVAAAGLAGHPAALGGHRLRRPAAAAGLERAVRVR